MTTILFRCLPLCGLLCILLTAACRQQEPIPIGFIGPLTGHHSDIGIYGRNGVTLAVEEVNRSGGINGRPIKLLIADGKQDPELARTAHQEMIGQGAAAIIGPMTSAMSMAVVPQTNRAGIVTISATTSTNKLTGMDDYFFRVMSPSSGAILRLVEYAYEDLGLRRISVIWDTANAAFSKEWLEYFQQYFADREGEVISVPFTPDTSLSFPSVAAAAMEESPDGIVLVTSALDSARICQQLNKQGSRAQLLASMWAMTEDFLQHAGNTAEGTVYSHWFDKDYQGKRSQEFRDAYQQRFDEVPNFASHFAYETAQVLFTALKHNDDPRQLKETILDIGTFQGTQGPITFDKYGDPERKVFLLTIKNRKFTPIQE